MASGTHPSSSRLVKFSESDSSRNIGIFEGEYYVQDGICYIAGQIRTSNEDIAEGSYVFDLDTTFPIPIFTVSPYYYLSSMRTGQVFYINKQGKFAKNMDSEAFLANTRYRFSGSYPCVEN